MKRIERSEKEIKRHRWIEKKIEKFQRNLKKLRRERKLTQKELSLLTGIDYTYIHKLESGEKQNPSLIILYKLCYGLMCNLAELTGEYEPK